MQPPTTRWVCPSSTGSDPTDFPHKLKGGAIRPLFLIEALQMQRLFSCLRAKKLVAKVGGQGLIEAQTRKHKHKQYLLET